MTAKVPYSQFIAFCANHRIFSMKVMEGFYQVDYDDKVSAEMPIVNRESGSKRPLLSPQQTAVSNPSGDDGYPRKSPQDLMRVGIAEEALADNKRPEIALRVTTPADGSTPSPAPISPTPDSTHLMVICGGCGAEIEKDAPCLICDSMRKALEGARAIRRDYARKKDLERNCRLPYADEK